MKINSYTASIAFFTASFVTASAATLVTSAFNLNPSTAVDTTGTADWGYFSRDGYTQGMTTGVAVNFDALTHVSGDPATVSKASPSTGEVFYTPTDSSSGTSNTTYGYTFDGTAVGSLLGNIGTSEEIFSMKFNDLGVGTHTMAFYIGASAANRALNIDYFVYEDDGAESSATLSATGVTSGSFANNRISYSLTFETSTANTDLVFNLGSAGSDGNAFTMGGYTLTTVPEPSAALLGGLGALLIFRRHR